MVRICAGRRAVAVSWSRTRSAGACVLGVVLGASWACVPSPRARADDLFEIQVFHARVNERNEPGLELHTNYVVRGSTRAPPELDATHVLYTMLEPTYGLGHGWEVGMHLQTAVRPSPEVDWGGVKLRAMKLFDVPSALPFRFALNFEGGYVPRRYDTGGWVLEVRPVLEARVGIFDFDVNPTVSFAALGEHAFAPRLEPSVAVRCTLLETVDLGLEYYASLGPVTALDPWSAERHYLFETLNVVRWPAWILRAGIGEGLTRSSNPLIITTIFGHLF